MVSLFKPGNLAIQKFHKDKDELEKIRPIDYILNFINDRIPQSSFEPEIIKPKGIGSRVIIIKAGTSSGKSTTIPPELYNKFYEISRKNIIVTQPRVLTAVDIPLQVIQFYKNLKLGENIGFKTGIVERKPNRGIIYMTIGVLIQQLKLLDDEAIMKKYSFILIDEVHDRSIQTDTALFYLKSFLQRNWQLSTCPLLILMSATIEPEIFMNYFECPENHFIEVKGFSHPIDNQFSKYQLSNYISYAINMAEKTHLENLTDIDNNILVRDILIFVQGNKDAKIIIEKLHKFNSEILEKTQTEIDLYLSNINQNINKNKINEITGGKDLPYYICPILITSDTYKEGGNDYKNLFSDLALLSVPIYSSDKKIIKYVKPSRKIIVGTNVVETGLTIPTLKYCIDTGFAKVNEFNPNFGISLFINKPITHDSAMQRRGRVGRKTSGIWYPCYTEEIFNNMINMSFPQIINNEITDMLLALIISETKTEIRLATNQEIKYKNDEFQKYKQINRKINIDNLDKNLNNKIESKLLIEKDKIFQMNQFDQELYIISSNNVFEAKNMDFIQFPPADSIIYSLEKLHGLGFINYDYSPTIFGFYGSKIRKVKIENIRLLFACYSYGGNMLDLITIIAMLEAKFNLKINKYKPRNLLGLSDIENTYYYKFIFADDFIEYLLIWYEFMDILNSYQNSFNENEIIVNETKTTKTKTTKTKTTKTKTTKTNKNLNFDKINNWAKENGFNIKDFYNITELRDEIIENFLILGLNPYYNGLNLPKGTYNLLNIMKRNIKEGYEEIIKIKKCIYEGYRYNLAIYNKKLNTYVTNKTHLPVTLETKLIRLDKKNLPMYVIIGKIELKESNKEKGTYEFIGSQISILDGYVNIDTEY